MTNVPRALRHAAALAAAVASVLLVAAPVAADDDIAGSDPESGAMLSEPIDAVTIDFGAAVEVVDLRLFTDDIDQPLPGTIVVVSPTTVRLEFEMLTREDEYFVRYVAREEGADDGHGDADDDAGHVVGADADADADESHFVSGAITFTYGSPADDTAVLRTFATVAPDPGRDPRRRCGPELPAQPATGGSAAQRRRATEPPDSGGSGALADRAVPVRAPPQRSSRILPTLALDSIARWAVGDVVEAVRESIDRVAAGRRRTAGGSRR